MSVSEKDLILMNFSGIYEEECFYDGEEIFLDFKEMDGVNGYCAEEAENKIKEKIKSYPLDAVHFLDSGNYHYLSKFWLDRIEVPFDLLVFDNHTDMQAAAFWGLLSCGSWIRETIETNRFLEKVCIIGPGEASFLEVQELKEHFCKITQEELRAEKEDAFLVFLKSSTRPLYISVDKDVLCMEDARTNWDQGEMRLKKVLEMIQKAAENRKILGMDVCGEKPSVDGLPVPTEECSINEKTNRALYECYKEIGKEQKHGSIG